MLVSLFFVKCLILVFFRFIHLRCTLFSVIICKEHQILLADGLSFVSVICHLSSSCEVRKEVWFLHQIAVNSWLAPNSCWGPFDLLRLKEIIKGVCFNSFIWALEHRDHTPTVQEDKNMDNFSTERPKSWSVYTSTNPTPSQTAADEREAPWKDFGTSVNAISFGFVATAILISLFLIMAIFEHLLSPRSSLPSTQDAAERALESGHMRSQRHVLEKLGSPPIVSFLVVILFAHL